MNIMSSHGFQPDLQLKILKVGLGKIVLHHRDEFSIHVIFATYVALDERSQTVLELRVCGSFNEPANNDIKVCCNGERRP